MNGLNKTYKEGKEEKSTEVSNNVVLGAIILTAIALFIRKKIKENGRNIS